MLDAHEWDSQENRQLIHDTFDAICRAYVQRATRNQAHRLHLQLKRLTDEAAKRRQQLLNEAEQEQIRRAALDWQAGQLALVLPAKVEAV